jgi:hypothetical protein
MSKTLKVCDKGHRFYKSSNCPTCPTCEQQRKPYESFLSELAAPARRALENKKITNLEQLSQYSEAEVSQLHGIGPNAILKLREALKDRQLSFKNEDTDYNKS